MNCQDYEEVASLMASSWAIIEHNETGMPDPTNPRSKIANGTQAQNKESQSFSQRLASGLIKYFKSGTGSKLEQLKHERPGAAWESFMNRNIRLALASYGMPYELVWEGDLSSAATRMRLAQCTRYITDRQVLMKRNALREIIYAVVKASQMPNAPFKLPKDFWAWDFTLPKSLSIDVGRDGNNLREDLRMGITTLTKAVGETGSDLETHVNEIVNELKLIKEKASQNGLSPEDIYGKLISKIDPNK
jgi:hypothetical protein